VVRCGRASRGSRPTFTLLLLLLLLPPLSLSAKLKMTVRPPARDRSQPAQVLTSSLAAAALLLALLPPARGRDHALGRHPRPLAACPSQEDLHLPQREPDRASPFCLLLDSLCPSRPCASTLPSSESVSGVAREAGTGAICRTTARPQIERPPVSLGSGSETRSKEGCSSCRL
jgi:hypothetical protein